MSKNLKSFHFQSGSLSTRWQNNEMFSFDRRKPPVWAFGTGISPPIYELRTNFQAQMHFISAREGVLDLITRSSIVFSMTHKVLQVKCTVHNQQKYARRSESTFFRRTFNGAPKWLLLLLVKYDVCWHQSGHRTNVYFGSLMYTLVLRKNKMAPTRKIYQSRICEPPHHPPSRYTLVSRFGC